MELGSTVYRAMVFMVVASPCAVVASIMPVVLSAHVPGGSQGPPVQRWAMFQTLSEIRVVAFDKTGTLTRGELAVTDLIPLEGIDEGRLLQEAATMESLSEHPLARAIVSEAEERGIAFGSRNGLNPKPAGV